MKKLLLLNWPAKLFCLVLAVIIWSFINHWVTTNDGVPSRGQLEEIRRSHPKSLREAGINAAGFKPVACGDRQDARLLREAGPKDLTLDELNPVFLRNATCPYVAARLENTQVDEKVILRAYDALSAAHECVVVEGVGGWEVPIGPGRNFSDMAADFKLPVLLVIGNKLGAINHALLTLNAIKERGLECLGIVFNNVKDEWDTACVTNRSMVEEFSDAPILGELIHGQDYMDMDALLERLH